MYRLLSQTMRLTKITITTIAIWWLTCLVFLASRISQVGIAAEFVAAKTAWLLPLKPFTNGWPSQDSMQFGYTRGLTDLGQPGLSAGERLCYFAQFTGPWAGVDSVLLGLLFPIHAACIYFVLQVFCRVGCPTTAFDISVQKKLFWKTFWRCMWLGMLWFALSEFVAAFWFHTSNPQLTTKGTPPVVMQAMVDIRPQALMIPTLAAFLGYLGSICQTLRRSIWDFNLGKTSETERWINDCLRCGYQVAPDKPCPECGTQHPLSIGGVYFGQWHAKLARRRFVDPVRLLIGCVVAILFAWPLVAGLFLK